jgi:zinc protease
LRQQITRAATGTAFFMYQLEGATTDSSRYGLIRSILNDYTQTTPAEMQALASRYLVRGSGWRLAVVPPGVGIAGVTSGAGGAPPAR